MNIKKEYIIPLTLIACALILGGSFLLVQVNKQASIEKQQMIKLEWEKEERAEREMLYGICVQRADTRYWSYVKLNRLNSEKDSFVRASLDVWDRADANKKEDIKNCYNLYLK